MASQGPPSSSFPGSLGPGARPMQPGDTGSILQELQEIRASYQIHIDSDALRLAYNFRGQDRKYDIPFASMPVSDGARWLLYGGTGRAKVTGLFTLDMIRGAENMAGRPLTQTEAEGFAFHTGKRMRYNFTGTLAGFGIGYLIAARTWKTMRFPFVKVKPIEAYDYFPAQRLPILKGQYSRLMWQITRANVYAGISLIFSQMIFGSLGDSVMTVGLYRDTRTQEVVKAMKGSFDRIRMNRSQPGQTPPAVQQRPGQDQDSQGEDFYGNEGKGMQEYYGKSSDYSGDQTFSDSTTDTGMLDDNTMRQRERQREYKQSQPSPQPQAQAPSGSGRRSDPDFFFDEASPTAGNNASMYEQSSRGSGGGGGGVWDRIRRGGQPQSQPKPQPSQFPEAQRPSQQSGGWQRPAAQNYENKADSFSFSSYEEDKQLAKDQAQKEFDAMLERERKEGGSESYASGSFAAESGSESPQQTGGSAWERRRRG